MYFIMQNSRTLKEAFDLVWDASLFRDISKNTLIALFPSVSLTAVASKAFVGKAYLT